MPGPLLAIALVIVLSGGWLLLNGRRSSAGAATAREGTPREATPRQTSQDAQAGIVRMPANERADPRLELSELQRAIGGRFDLPSLDMDPATDRASAVVPTLVTPEAVRPSPSVAPAVALPEVAPATVVPIITEPRLREQMAMRLELASNYIAIDDIDRARELLEEVLRQGDAPQRLRARSLLDRLR